jgi:hypothetical protein
MLSGILHTVESCAFIAFLAIFGLVYSYTGAPLFLIPLIVFTFDYTETVLAVCLKPTIASGILVKLIDR